MVSRLSHSSNISKKLNTLDTSQFSIPLIVFKFLHPANILLNDLMLDSCHPERSRDSTWDCPKNRHFNASTFGGIAISLKSTFFPWASISSFIISLKSIRLCGLNIFSFVLQPDKSLLAISPRIPSVILLNFFIMNRIFLYYL